jgi:putative oxidoreductase
MRLTVGGYFAGHGMQKLAGWFGGGGPEGTAQFFEQLGLRPGKRHALAAGASETGGGLLLALGLATPAAAAAISAVMLTAIRFVHWKNGPWNGDQGYELNVVVLAALAALVEAGPGPLSLDSALGIERRGTAVALGALGAGAVGSLVASELGRRGQPSPDESVAAS